MEEQENHKALMALQFGLSTKRNRIGVKFLDYLFFSPFFKLMKHLFLISSLKNTLIVIWMISLIGLGLTAMTGSVYRLYDDVRTAVISFVRLLSDAPKDTSDKLLEVYIIKHYSNLNAAPPLAVVLDHLQLEPPWRRCVSPPSKDDGERHCTRDVYHPLFQKVAARLHALAATTPTGSSQEASFQDFIPPPSFNMSNDKKIDLPVEAYQWLQEERKRIQENALIISLFDTFFLLIVLGGFGSLIFLIREHQENDQAIPIKAYVYRPILGMSLALAIFIADASLHALISSADIENIRKETLLLLALSAGLVSEQAYSAIYYKAKEAIEKFKGEREKAQAKVAKESKEALKIFRGDQENDRDK